MYYPLLFCYPELCESNLNTQGLSFTTKDIWNTASVDTGIKTLQASQRRVCNCCLLLILSAHVSETCYSAAGKLSGSGCRTQPLEEDSD